MSRTIPRAYVTAAWNKNPVVAKEDTKKYCQELVKVIFLYVQSLLLMESFQLKIRKLIRDSRRCLRIYFVEPDSLLSVVISRMRKLRMILQ